MSDIAEVIGRAIRWRCEDEVQEGTLASDILIALDTAGYTITRRGTAGVMVGDVKVSAAYLQWYRQVSNGEIDQFAAARPKAADDVRAELIACARDRGGLDESDLTDDKSIADIVDAIYRAGYDHCSELSRED